MISGGLLDRDIEESIVHYDPVCDLKPSATLIYSAGLLTRVDYSDGRTKDLTYTSGILTRTECDKPDGNGRIRKNLLYTSGLLSSVQVLDTSNLDPVLAANADLYLKAGFGVNETGGKADSWIDRVLGHTFQSVLASEKPVPMTDGNGDPFLRFDGVGNMMTGIIPSLFSKFDGDAGRHFFMLCKLNGISPQEILTYIGGSSFAVNRHAYATLIDNPFPGSIRCLLFNDSASIIRDENTSDAVAPDTLVLIEGDYGGGIVNYSFDGAGDSGNPGNWPTGITLTGFDFLTLCARGQSGSSSLHCQMDLYAYVLGDFTASEAVAIRAELQTLAS